MLYWFKIRIMRLLFVFVLLLGLLSCEENKMKSSHIDASINNKSNWTNSQKKDCIDEYMDGYQYLSDEDYFSEELICDVYKTSFEETASCFCDLAEKKYLNYNDFYDLNEYEYGKIDDESLVLLIKDNSKIKNWSFEMKTFCNKLLLFGWRKFYGIDFSKRKVNCLCEIFENEYSTIWDVNAAFYDGYINQKELEEKISDECSN